MSVFNTASNIVGGAGTLTIDRFLEFYPQFAAATEQVLNVYITACNSAITPERWGAYYEMAACLYVAHFVVLHYRSCGVNVDTSDPSSIAKLGSTQGEISSKSIDGVSVSYGQNQGTSDLQGFGAFKDTAFGQQLATLAKLVGMGGMYVV